MSESLSRDKVKRRYGRRTTRPPVAVCSPAARPPADGSEEPRKSIHPDRRLRNEAAIPEDRKLALQAQSYAAERHQECGFPAAREKRPSRATARKTSSWDRSMYDLVHPTFAGQARGPRPAIINSV